MADLPANTIGYRTLGTHDALVQSLPGLLQISRRQKLRARRCCCRSRLADTRKGSGKIQILVQGALHDSHEHRIVEESEEHTSELQSRLHLVCRLLLEKKNQNTVRRTLQHR